MDVSRANRSDGKARRPRIVGPCCIKVSNLSTTVTEDTLRKLFENCGQLGLIHINRETQDAFVNFEDSDSVLKAMKLDGATLDTASIKVVRVDKALAVYIEPMDKLYLESFLKDLNVAHYHNNVRGNYKAGYVYFSDEKSYLAALSLDGTNQDGRIINVKPRSKQSLCLLLSSGQDSEEIKSFIKAVRSKSKDNGTLKDNKKPAKKSKVAIEGVSEPSGLNMVRKQSQQVAEKKGLMKKRKMELTKALGVVSKPSGGVKILEKQQSSEKKKRKMLNPFRGEV